MLKWFREPVNGLTHLGAAVLAIPGLVLLLYVSRADVIKQVSILVYGISLILMFSASAAYHSIPVGEQGVLRLRKLDHSAIYLLIAGTYTPICIYFFTGFWKWGLLTIIWALALVGIVIKLFLIRAPRWLNAGIYLVMGWLAVAGIREILSAMPAGSITWLLLGGLFFTIGAVVYILKKPNIYPGVFGFHELWHIFVILGCLCHFLLIAMYVAPTAWPG